SPLFPLPPSPLFPLPPSPLFPLPPSPLLPLPPSPLFPLPPSPLLPLPPSPPFATRSAARSSGPHASPVARARSWPRGANVLNEHGHTALGWKPLAAISHQPSAISHYSGPLRFLPAKTCRGDRPEGDSEGD